MQMILRIVYSLEPVAWSIGDYMNVNKKECMCFKREGAISTLSSKPLKLVDKFPYLGSNISSNKSDVEVRLAKAWTDID